MASLCVTGSRASVTGNSGFTAPAAGRFGVCAPVHSTLSMSRHESWRAAVRTCESVPA